MTRCPNCGTENPPGAQFCMRCGTPLPRRCPNCGSEDPRDAHFCLRCGVPLAAVPSAERRVVSLLFADMVGSRALAVRLDPEAVRGLLADYFAAMREEVERHGGVVEKFIGDAIMAVFGLPAAHEDDAERALRAAVAMRERMAAINERLHAGLRIRIGITTGEVVTDPAAVRAGEFMVTGEVVNLAARAAARPLVLVFEDLHWAEESLLDLLEHLAVRSTDAPILLLGLARPELLERYPHWGGRVRNYTALSLSPLPEALGRRLITDLLQGEAVPADVRDAILARAEGNPFFIEEILRMLIDGGGLVRDGRGWHWASYPPEIRIPDTIHGILASRLDLLTALEKRAVLRHGEAMLSLGEPARAREILERARPLCRDGAARFVREIDTRLSGTMAQQTPVVDSGTAPAG